MVGDPLVSLGDRIDALDVSRKGLGEHQGDNILSNVEGVILPNLLQRIEVVGNHRDIHFGVRSCLGPEAGDHCPTGVIGNGQVTKNGIPRLLLDTLIGHGGSRSSSLLVTRHRVILGLKGCDLGLASNASADQSNEESPAQVNVQIQAHQGLGSIVESLNGLEVFGENGAVRKLAHKKLLFVRVCSRSARKDEQT